MCIYDGPHGASLSEELERPICWDCAARCSKQHPSQRRTGLWNVEPVNITQSRTSRDIVPAQRVAMSQPCMCAAIWRGVGRWHNGYLPRDRLGTQLHQHTRAHNTTYACIDGSTPPPPPPPAARHTKTSDSCVLVFFSAGNLALVTVKRASARRSVACARRDAKAPRCPGRAPLHTRPEPTHRSPRCFLGTTTIRACTCWQWRL